MTPASETPKGWSKDSGAALVTVLVLLAVMAVLATALVEAARFSLARLDNQRQMDQARWYLLGAERVATERANDALAAIGSSGAGSDWQGRTFTYPIDGGGISLTLWDASNCFNLNSLVSGSEEGGTVANAAAQIELAQILKQTRVAAFNPDGLVAALTDYLDADQSPMPGGAEDAPGGYENGYRTANTLAGDVSELLRVRGFTPDIVAAITPYVCVRPRAGVSPINVNTLEAQDAVLLSAMFGDGLPLRSAQALIASRPTGGWPDIEAFFADPLLAELEVSDAFKARFAVQPRYVVMTARVRWEGLEEGSAALIELGPPSRIVRRVLGPQVTERSV